jgi:fucose 4-O-acetylase-like acetyltransferase
MIMRDNTFDVLKGIGIISMIIGHMCIPDFLRNFIFSFHMPLFFLIGGYFFKPQPFKEIIYKSTSRLLKPYVIIGLLTPIIYLLVGDYNTAVYRGVGIFWGNNGSPHAVIHTPLCGAVWFLLALFWCRLIFCYIYTNTRKWFVLSIILSVIANVLGYYIVNPPLGIVIGMSALVFFSIGKALQECKHNLRIFFYISIFIWFFCLSFSKLEMAIFLYKCYPLDIIGACGGTFVFYMVAKGIYIYTSLTKKIILFIGVNSLLILCYHQLVDHSIAALNNNIYEIKHIYNMAINLVLPIVLAKVHRCIVQHYYSV